MNFSDAWYVGRLVAAASLTSLVAGICADARAGLGDSVAAIEVDQARLKGDRKQAMALRAKVQAREIVMPDGSRITEFADSSGKVFAVSWSTRFKPNLDLLLGRHAATFAAAASEAMRAPGVKRFVVLRRDDLVVHATSHLNSFVGRAYLRSLIPAGFNVDELR